MFSIDDFHKAYDANPSEVVINGSNLTFYLPKTIDRFIDPSDVMNNFPLWTKIWEASGVLAGYIADMPVEKDKSFLEIGAGVGVVGISAAKAGHRVTLTEYNPDALNFAKANAVKNNCRDLIIEKLDWNAPHLTGRFDCIMGSELVYKETNITPLFNLFKKYLKPDGEIILAESVKETGLTFWRRMQEYFDIKVNKQTLTSNSDKMHIVIFKMKFKENMINH